VTKKPNLFQPSELRSLPKEGLPIIVEVTRGTAVESRHNVHAVLTDHNGKVLGTWGREDHLTFPRSAIKALQATAFVTLGAHEKYKLTQKELAIACASHFGESTHTLVVDGLLKKAGLAEKDLECGPQKPSSGKSYIELIKSGGKPSAIFNNCSGKHAGMLCGCKTLGVPTENYSHYNHPYQERVRHILEEFYGLNLDKAPWGVDGCGIPSIGVPLKNLALGMAQFAESSGLRTDLNSAAKILRGAIREEPYMIGGADSVCTQITQGTKGECMAKVGAEGVYGAMFPGLGLGLALKAEDGNARAVEVVIAQFVRKLGVKFSLDGKTLESFCQPIVKNWSKEAVGELRVGN
jgi:L-asparaginase II